MEVEDHYLSGKILDRVDRKDLALKAWATALEVDPNHPETLDEVTRLLSKTGRPDEAARAAERLARQPGWQARGLLLLGSIRDEINDPGGAAEAFRRALAHDPAALAKSHDPAKLGKQVARAFLRVAKPDEARPPLEGILAEGPDPEASWLLSRAALQAGETAEASASLAKAGPYRADHPLEPEPGPYVGEGRCAPAMPATHHAAPRQPARPHLPLGCGADGPPDPGAPPPRPRQPEGHARPEAGRRSAHGRDAHRGQALPRPGRIRVRDARPLRDDGQPRRQGAISRPPALALPFGRRLGVGQDVGRLAPPAGRGRLPGPSDRRARRRRPMPLLPHDQWRGGKDRVGPESADRGIGCERCHGPGGNHLAAVGAGLADPAIINPALADSEGITKLCSDCHVLGHSEPSTSRADPDWVRSQGVTLTWSRCYTESGGSFTCLTCHDPHRNAETRPAAYEAKCLSCHSRPPPANSRRRPRRVACPVSPARDCLGCHMPKVRNAVLHTDLTDHYIRVRDKPDAGK